MPGTLLEEITAQIDRLDLGSLRATIENNQQANGRLLVNLNDFSRHGYRYNILGYLLQRYEFSTPNAQDIHRILDMVSYLTMTRDQDGNLLFDINLTNNRGDNLVNLAIASQLPIENRRYVLQTLLDARDHTGELLLRRDAGSEALKSAIVLADLPILEALLDARTAEGDYFVNIRGQLRICMHNAIGYANSNIYDAAKREQVVTALRNAFIARGLAVEEGTYTAPPPAPEVQRAPVHEVGRVVNQPIPAPTQPQQQRAATHDPNRAAQQVARFMNDTQNTHDPSVTHTSKGTLLALNSRYQDGLNEDSAVREIEDLCEQFDYDSITIIKGLSRKEKKLAALEFLNLIKQRFQSTHSYTGLNYKRILSIIWQGIIDRNINAYPIDMHRNIQFVSGELDNLIKLKKASMVEKFIEATLTYRNNRGNLDICVGGGIHKILETLNRAHVDVLIATGDQSVLPLANEMAISLVGIELLKKDTAEQNEILKTWNADESVGTEFKTAVTAIVAKKLSEHFGVLLSNAQISGITSAIVDLPRPPVPSKELNIKVDEIENIPPTGCEAKKEALTKIKQYASEIYCLDLSIEKKLEKLEKLEKLIAAYQHADKLLTIINDLNNGNAESRLAMINKLKTLANQLYTLENIADFTSAYNTLFSDYKFLKQCDSFLEIENVYKNSNPKRLLSIQQIKTLICEAFSSYASSTETKSDQASLISKIEKIRDSIINDHKKYGAGRLFGRYQPESKLVKQINDSLSLKSNL